jgi:hypothetical protein
MFSVVPERAISVRVEEEIEDVRPAASGTDTPEEAVRSPVTAKVEPRLIAPVARVMVFPLPQVMVVPSYAKSEWVDSWPDPLVHMIRLADVEKMGAAVKVWTPVVVAVPGMVTPPEPLPTVRLRVPVGFARSVPWS